MPPCELQYLDYYVRFFAANVDDRLRPTAGGINPRAGAESIYSADFKRIVAGPEVLTVNRFTIEQDLKYLLPRAVAYSTSLIDYIFRGEIKVAAPSEGVYAHRGQFVGRMRQSVWLSQAAAQAAEHDTW